RRRPRRRGRAALRCLARTWTSWPSPSRLTPQNGANGFTFFRFSGAGRLVGRIVPVRYGQRQRRMRHRLPGRARLTMMAADSTIGDNRVSGTSAMIRCLLSLLGFLSVAAAADSLDDAKPWVAYPGGDGPGKGKHVVLIAGDDEYHSEEAMPQLGKIL